MTKYSVHLDITLSGSVEIEANSIAEAEAKAKQITQPTSSFYHFSTDVVEGDTEVVELDTCSVCGDQIDEGRARQLADESIVCEDCFIEATAKARGLT